MPIIIAREGPPEPRETRPLTAEQKAALWERIVLNYCRNHPEQLRAALAESKEAVC